ncbi:pimeloyl-ACP methyl ester carboxylesterase [Streptomyces paradoxus]|uniref:Pimeloyl-ACP methyl ester carboxylesterase n=1 Tax=Streptomyces paradoxus TaxID=66375 RepID=A0A7W9TD86_9ACTN|nr:pimeloyl-ACP methyl ester carboxylesterase [Streptomyces paradoxus]
MVICLHGWPYDIHSYVDVAPLPAGQGYRVIVPYLRGHGTTRFRSARTFRNAQQSAIAMDVIALMDALKIERAVLAAFPRRRRRPSRGPSSTPITSEACPRYGHRSEW